MGFEEAQKRKLLEDHVSALVRDLHQLKGEREALSLEVSEQREELARSEALHAEREVRLSEASGELSLAEEVIDDITSSKCVGLRRFFERYNLPSVLLALFRKTVEQQSQLRASRSSAHQGSHASLPSGGSASSSRPSLSCSGPTAAFEAEVRQHMSLHGEGSVSRHGLQVYIEGLRLALVSSVMVTQVVLALLDLNTGESVIDVSRFLGALASPPSWEQLDFGTALWGAVGEPALAVVQKHRRSRTLSGSSGCGASPRASLPLRRTSIVNSRAAAELAARQKTSGWH